MKSIAIERLEAEDIGKQVEKIIKGLGYPEPPLRLEEVRELLSLDRQFYSSSDTGAVREFVSRLKVAGKQIIWRPTLLWDAIKKADLSALYLLDQKRILIDESKPKLKHRWNEAHEIIHSVIPWHNEMNMGDTDLTLKPTCHAIVEAEANFGAGQLLFLQGRFAIDARDCDCSVEAIKGLSKRYGNTITSTLWRFVEQVYPDKAIVGIISQHPNHTTPDFDPSRPCRHCIQSPKFRQEFSQTSEVQLFAAIWGYCGNQRKGPLGKSEIPLVDDNGVRHLFHFESFGNTYEVLTLGVNLGKCRLTVAH